MTRRILPGRNAGTYHPTCHLFTSTHEARIRKLVSVAAQQENGDEVTPAGNPSSRFAQTPPRKPGINQIAPPLSTTTLAHPTATPPCVHSLGGKGEKETANA
jgi:hypothetical protein